MTPASLSYTRLRLCISIVAAIPIWFDIIRRERIPNLHVSSGQIREVVRWTGDLLTARSVFFFFCQMFIILR